MEAHNAKSLFKSDKKKTERYDEIGDFLKKTTFTAAFAGFAGALEEKRKDKRRKIPADSSMTAKLLKNAALWSRKPISESTFKDLRKLKDRRTVELFSKDSKKVQENILKFLRERPQKGALPRLREFLSRGNFRDQMGRRAYHDIFRAASYAWEIGFNEFSYDADAEKAIRKALSHALHYGEELRKEYPSITGVKAGKAGA